MSAEQRSTAAPSASGDLAARYEQLREHALRGSGRGAGLIVFLRQGMRAWMEASFHSAPAASAPFSTSAAGAVFPPHIRADVVLVLAAMALGRRQERRPRL